MGTVFLGSGQRLRGGMKLRNNTVRRRSHENLFHCRATLAVWAALIVPLFATIAAPPAAAQIVAGPGQSVTVPPNTIITCTDCVALETLGPPGGTITTAPGPFTLNVTSTGIFTAGANVLPVTGGVIQLTPIIRGSWRLAMRAHDISRVDGGRCSGTLATRWN